VVLKKLFGKSASEKEREYTIDDLIVLERYDDAIDKLQIRIKARDDLHDHLKMADCYTQLRQVERAIDEYIYVSDKYAVDGFYDRSLAVLGKARRLNPMEETLPKKVETINQLKKLEVRREEAQEGFMEGAEGEVGAKGTAVVEFQSIWKNLTKTRLVWELSGPQLRLLFAGVRPVHVLPGNKIATRAQRDDSLYIIVSGVVSAWFGEEDTARSQVRSFGPGDIIGDGALFEHRPWPANYSAGSRASLLRLTEEGLKTCLTGNPDPRGFLEVLRRQNSDREIGQAVARMET